jgi:hypothetical protein
MWPRNLPKLYDAIFVNDERSRPPFTVAVQMARRARVAACATPG